MPRKSRRRKSQRKISYYRKRKSRARGRSPKSRRKRKSRRNSRAYRFRRKSKRRKSRRKYRRKSRRSRAYRLGGFAQSFGERVKESIRCGIHSKAALKAVLAQTAAPRKLTPSSNMRRRRWRRRTLMPK